MWINKNKGVLLHTLIIDRLNSVKNVNFLKTIMNYQGLKLMLAHFPEAS